MLITATRGLTFGAHTNRLRPRVSGNRIPQVKEEPAGLREQARRRGTVRPAWARSSGCKSPAELATARQVKRNCVRVTERGKEAWSVNREPMDKNRIRGVAGQGEQAVYCKALVATGQAA